MISYAVEALLQGCPELVGISIQEEKSCLRLYYDRDEVLWHVREWEE